MLPAYLIDLEFQQPDGRATWQSITAVTVDGGSVPLVRLRRLGGDEILR